jgi:hypothetical protein
MMEVNHEDYYKFRLWCSGLTDILEEWAASVFRVEVCRVRNWFHYGRLQGRLSLRPVGVGKEMEPVWAPGIGM